MLEEIQAKIRKAVDLPEDISITIGDIIEAWMTLPQKREIISEKEMARRLTKAGWILKKPLPAQPLKVIALLDEVFNN